MFQTVLQKEIREMVRDGRLRLLGGLVMILAVAALAFGAQQTWEAREAREHASEIGELVGHVGLRNHDIADRLAGLRRQRPLQQRHVRVLPGL